MPIQTKADLYRMHVQAWERTATEDDRIDLVNWPEPPKCTVREQAIAFVDEDGDIIIGVHRLDREQGEALAVFLRDVLGPVDATPCPCPVNPEGAGGLGGIEHRANCHSIGVA